MAFIGKLRDKMGTWVVVFVFLAISAFVLQDIFSNNSVLFSNSDSVGEIAGHTVSLKEYQQAVREREANFIMFFNRQPNDRDMVTIREQAWEMLILRHAIENEFEKVGVKVSDDEMVDMISGKNINDGIKQSFINPQTGQFDRGMLGNYISQIKLAPETSPERMQWELFQRDLRPSRERLKYENLLIKSAFITSAEAEKEYHLQNDVAEIQYLFVPYYAVSDTAIKVNDSDLKAYYNKNKEKYKSEHTRDMKFVTFPVVPSADDSLSFKEELTRLVGDFKAAQDDSVFAIINSDNSDAYTKFNVSNLPSYITADELVAGTVKGPFLDEGSYKLVKVSKVGKDTINNARASHILIRWDNDTEAAKKEAKEKARNILKDIKAGASFADKAREFGTDGTATRGGDLGWFSTGAMVKPFETAVFSATKKGVLNDVVETEFGYHIIDVTEVKDNNYYTLAVIEREILPSDASINAAIRKAELFASELSGLKEFTDRATKEGLTVYEAKNIAPAERRINNLGDARQVVQWLFRDAKEGKVSSVFDLQDQYAVAVMTGEIEKGYKPLDLVKDEITPLVKNEMKGKVIVEKLKGLQGSLNDIAAAFGKDATVYTNSSVRLNSNSLTSVGFDPVVIGKVFSLADGSRSQAYAGENGVVIIETKTKTPAPAIGDYTMFKTQLQQSATSRNSANIASAIKEAANIEDTRFRFY
ncbi:MAG: SurA N-terminal domain-containing protein [Cyclobacteriaceae bacterium]|nr:SurA N-terminal domain-containing protein [Cyclobacteriaceae bacterium]UYN86507.1 MAG: SurA N-terminal domain-containing protein [Cyclobacteriaceae bacterium]